MTWTGRSLYHAFCDTAEADPRGIAWLERCDETQLDCRWRDWTWQRVHAVVDAMAAWLEAHEIHRGDRLVSALPNGLDWALIDLACSATGAIHAPLDLRMPEPAMLGWMHRIRPALCIHADSGSQSFTHALSCARIVITAQQLRKEIEAVSISNNQVHRWRARVEDDATACILSTSGTTGSPKGVMLSHRNLISNAAAKFDAMPQSPDDLRLNLLPFAHAYAKTCELGVWAFSGGTMACSQGMRQTLEHARQLKPTLINAVPAFYHHVANEAEGDVIHAKLGGRIRRLASGGAPLLESLRALYERLGFPIYQGYGLTEASPVVCSNRAGTTATPACLLGVGPAVTDTRLRLDGDNRLWVRGPGVMQGYWNDPGATEARIMDGWLDTGDHANLHGAARASSVDVPLGAALSITGRSDDIQVLANGYKFSPAPWERILMDSLPIERCILIGNHRVTPLLAVQTRADSLLSPPQLLAMALDALRDAPRYCQPARLVIDREAWTPETGLVHWKGHLLRRALETRFAD
ncbi:MAG: AMP-binding protein [Pirellula sp.]